MINSLRKAYNSTLSFGKMINLHKLKTETEENLKPQMPNL